MAYSPVNLLANQMSISIFKTISVSIIISIFTTISISTIIPVALSKFLSISTAIAIPIDSTPIYPMVLFQVLGV